MFAPLPQFFVPRPDVVGALGRAATERLTLIVAPAGFGKSLLLTDWMGSHVGVPITGLTLDRRDDDGRLLARRLVEALQVIDADIGKVALQRTDRSGRSLGESHLAQLLGDIELAGPGILVIDEVENVTTPGVLRDLFTLIDHAAPSLCIVLATRFDPDHRWVQEPQNQFRMADLAFRPEEAALLLRRVSGRDLSPRQVETVLERTEGWPAGLQMFGVALRRGADIDELIAGLTGADRAIGEYLTDAVLARQPEAIRRFLLQTSVLHHLSPGLCRFVTGEATAPELLRTVEKHSLFLIPSKGRDQDAPWFRYQRLFRERLRKELVILWPGSDTTLLRSAAAWHLANDQRELAMEYLIEARDWEQVLDLTIAVARSMFEQGEAAAVLTWLHRVPEVIRRSRPEILLIEAMVLTVVGSTIQAEDRIDALLESRTPTIGELAVINLLRSVWVSNHRSAEQVIRDADAVLESLDLAPSATYPDPLGMTSVSNLRIGAVLNRARAFWFLGDTGRSRAELQALNDGPNEYSPWRIETLASLSLVELWSGHLREAHRMAAKALVVASQHNLSGHPSLMDALLVTASLSRERDQLGRSEMVLDQVLALALGVQRWATVATHAVERAALDLALGDPRGGLERLAKFAASGYPTLHPMIARRLITAEARLRLATGDLLGAGGLLDAFQGSSNPEMQALRVQLCIRDGDLDSARELLRDWATTEDLRSQIEHELCAAAVQNALGVDHLAQQHLASALALAEPDVYVRVFHDCGLDLLDLLRQRFDSHPSPYLERILAHSGTDPSSLNGGQRSTLSPRELTVLRYLPTRFSNAELAAELFISQNTVKSHLHSIYRQLEVTGRRAAVIEAERRGLL